MGGQPAGFSVLKRTVVNALSGLYQCVSVRPGRPKITDSNWMKPSLVCMYYMHCGYQTSIFGKNHAYFILIFSVLTFTDVERL